MHLKKMKTMKLMILKETRKRQSFYELQIKKAFGDFCCQEHQLLQIWTSASVQAQWFEWLTYHNFLVEVQSWLKSMDDLRSREEWCSFSMHLACIKIANICVYGSVVYLSFQVIMWKCNLGRNSFMAPPMLSIKNSWRKLVWFEAFVQLMTTVVGWNKYWLCHQF